MHLWVGERDGLLTVRQQPGCFWLFGAFFVLIGGTFLLGGLGVIPSQSAISPLGRAAVVLLGAAGIAAGVYGGLRVPPAAIVLDRGRQTLAWRPSWPWAAPALIVPLGEVGAVGVAEQRDGDGDVVYRLEVTLRSGRVLALPTTPTAGRESCERAAERLRAYLGR